MLPVEPGPEHESGATHPAAVADAAVAVAPPVTGTRTGGTDQEEQTEQGAGPAGAARQEAAAGATAGSWLAAFTGRMVLLLRWLWRPQALADVVALITLPVLVLLFYRTLLFEAGIAAAPELFRRVYPLRQLLAGSLREGQAPQWNPYTFTGMPLLADLHHAALYPGTLLLRWWDAPEVFARSTAAHAVVAAVGMYLCVRYGLRLVQAAAFVSAVVFGLGGFIGANAIEPEIVEAAAWTPLVLLGAALGHRSLIAGSALAAAALALSALAGRPQVTLLTLGAGWLLLLVLAVPPALPRWRPTRAGAGQVATLAGRSLLLAGLIPALGAALAAVQLLPWWELQADRNAGGLLLPASTAVVRVPAGAMVQALLPGFSENPDRQFISYTGVIALGLAVLGLRRGARPAAFGLLVLIAGLLVSLADPAPLRRLLAEAMAGDTAGMQPSHGLLLVTLGVAVLAGAGVDALWPRSGRRPRRRWWSYLWRDALVALVLLDLAVLILIHRGAVPLPGAGVQEIWLGLAVIAVDVAVVLPLLRPRRWLALAVVLALTVELIVAGARLPFTQTTGRLAFEVEPAIVPLLRFGDAPARVARMAGIAASDLPPEPGFGGYQTVRQGRDRLAGGSAMLDQVNVLDAIGDAGFTPAPSLRALGLTGTGILNSDIRDLLGPRLGVTHVFGPPNATVSAGAVEFVAGVPLEIVAGGERRLVLTDRHASTGLALLADVIDAPADGSPAVEVIVSEAGAPDRLRTLVAGVDVGDSQRLSPSRLVVLPDGGRALATEQSFGRPAVFQALTIRNITPQAQVRLYALALLDDRSGVARPVILDRTLEPVAGTGPTLYLDRRTPARASLARSYVVEPDRDTAIRRAVDLPPGTVVVDRQPTQGVAPSTEAGVGSARIARYSTSQVEVLVSAPTPSLLVLRDAAGRGWSVRVDGTISEMLLVDGMFRGVAVAGGTHSVVFRYQTPGLRRGLMVSAVTLLGMVGLLLLLAPRPSIRRHRQIGDATGERGGI